MPLFQWLDDERLMQDQMLDGMEMGVRKLFERLCTVEGGLSLLRFFHTQPDTLMTLEDIAYFVDQPHALLKRNLRALHDLGLARCIDVVGLRFFGLTNKPDQREIVRDLCTWQDAWYARVSRVENVITGKW